MSSSRKPHVPTPFPEIYAALHRAEQPDPVVIRKGFDAIVAGAWSGVQVAAFAVLVDRWSLNAEVLTSAAEALRRIMLPAPIEPVYLNGPILFDLCGTGGDGLQTLNISTAAAIVLATTGVPVAKHGNRSASGRVGSADVLEALGVPVTIPITAHASIFKETNITFLFAPSHHRSMEHAANARRQLGVRTVFNVLGPLMNPAPITHHLLGVSSDALRVPVAETLKRLGMCSAWVVHGTDGMDEMSPCGPTNITVLQNKHISEQTLAPEDFGLERIPLEALKCGTAAENAKSIEQILRGEPHPARNAVLLNAAAAALVIFPERGDQQYHPNEARVGRIEKVQFMERAIDEGRVWKKLEHWRRTAAHYAPLDT